jgi:hypothetical protein
LDQSAKHCRKIFQDAAITQILGAISVFDQMALYNGNNTYKGKPLFRSGIMDSGMSIAFLA